MELSVKNEKRLIKIGERLRELRKKAGYKSYENFAFDNEINRVQYGRMEKGANITLVSLLNVLDIHKITLEDFFMGLK
jgi:transcriptional regulator with XRE-family HTH domain